MESTVECSGGSAANSMAGLASLGGRAVYIGKVRDDALGETFRHDIREAGVAFDTPAAESGPPTGRCLILVTPDAQRTMVTHLGVSSANALTPGACRASGADSELGAPTHRRFTHGLSVSRIAPCQ